jgi:hypothetical protein
VAPCKSREKGIVNIQTVGGVVMCITGDEVGEGGRKGDGEGRREEQSEVEAKGREEKRERGRVTHPSPSH